MKSNNFKNTFEYLKQFIQNSPSNNNPNNLLYNPCKEKLTSAKKIFKFFKEIIKKNIINFIPDIKQLNFENEVIFLFFLILSYFLF